MDLANHSYATVQSYLKINLLKKIDQTPCVEIVFDEKHQDIFFTKIVFLKFQATLARTSFRDV